MGLTDFAKRVLEGIDPAGQKKLDRPYSEKGVADFAEGKFRNDDGTLSLRPNRDPCLDAAVQSVLG